MLRKLVWVPVLAIALLPAVAHAQFSQGDWEMTLTGSGGSDRDLDTTALGASGSLGYFFSDQFEVGVRQAIAVADTEDDSSWNGSTRGFIDYHFDLDRWQPFLGLSAGYRYGDDVDDDWVGGPEGGVKYFVNESTFVFVTVAYDFLLSESFSDTGAWVYNLGLGFRW